MAGTIRDLSFSDGVEIAQPTDAPANIGSIKAAVADYTFLDGDGFTHVYMTTSSTDRTVTLPTASDNSGRKIVIKKVDSGTGKVTVDGEGAETIDGATTFVILDQYDSLSAVCDGTEWHVQESYSGVFESATIATPSSGFTGTQTIYLERAGNICLLEFPDLTHSSASSVSSASGFIPVGFRPASSTHAYNTTIASGDATNVQVFPDGTLTIFYRDFAATSKTNSREGSITYRVAT